MSTFYSFRRGRHYREDDSVMPAELLLKYAISNVLNFAGVNAAPAGR